MARMPSSVSNPSSVQFHVRPTVSPSAPHLKARLGRLSLIRPGGDSTIKIPTPGLWAYTSRGVVPHLTQDHVNQTPSIKGLHIPFESYLELNPPAPLALEGPLPLHRYHGFDPERHILSFGLRDLHDSQLLHANGKDYVIAQCARGSKIVQSAQFNLWATAMQPDILFALPDIPYTLAPYSQKRLIKSTERTVRWLTSLLKYQFSQNLPPRSAIFAHLLGGSVLAARDAFTQSLLEPLEDKDSIDLPEIECVDQALSGYVLDLIPIRLSNIESPTSSTSAHILTPLLQASLEPLPASKPRLVTGVSSPHEILRCVAEVGIDIFDSGWAQKCADNGVALDFEFPVVRPRNMSAADARTRFAGAHNLYDERYAMDFGRLADNFSSAWEARSQAKSESASEGQRSLSVCTCMACSPLSPATTIQHSAFDVKMIENSTPTGDSSSEPGKTKFANEPPIPPFTRAYVHHLLHTHEMSAHTFLVSHNLAVLEAFFCGIRDVLAMSGSELGSESEITGTGGSLSSFGAEMVRFEAAYDENALCGPDGILHQGNRCWRIVEDLRGKGRFRREKEAEALGNTFPRAAPDADF